MLSSFFLNEILQVIAHYGYNPVTDETSYNNIVHNYPHITSFLTGSAEISNAPSNTKMKLQSLSLPSTFFHRILFLYYIYMKIPAVAESNYHKLFKYYHTRQFDMESFGEKFSRLNILKFNVFFKNIYKFVIYEAENENYDAYKRTADAMDLIEKSNFFIPDEIEVSNENELHVLKKPDQLELNNRSQHDILLDMFTMALTDNDMTQFADKTPVNVHKRKMFEVCEFHKLFQTILNVTKRNNPIICPEEKPKEKPKENKKNDKEKEDAPYVPNESENDDDEG